MIFFGQNLNWSQTSIKKLCEQDFKNLPYIIDFLSKVIEIKNLLIKDNSSIFHHSYLTKLTFIKMND